MQLIGITVFSDKKSGTLINTIDTKTKLVLGKRAKSDAVSYYSHLVYAFCEMAKIKIESMQQKKKLRMKNTHSDVSF